MLDSHLHLWDPEVFEYPWLRNEAALNRPFLPHHVPAAATASGGVIFIQADCRDDQGLDEVDWVLALAPRWPALTAVVAFAPLERAGEIDQYLRQLQERPLVKGVRRLFQDRDAGFMLAESTLDGARKVAAAGLTFDACVRATQLRELAEFAARTPQLSIVIDHMGKPTFSPDGIASWENDMKELARHPNVAVKLSGAPPNAPPGAHPGTTALPFITKTIEIFGPQRCMVGSDWPVSVTAPADYTNWFHLVLDNAMAGASPRDRADVASGSARRFYGLQKD